MILFATSLLFPVLKSQSEPSLGSQGMDKTFTVQSPADKEEEEEEERPNSARRQWTHESTQVRIIDTL